MKFSHGERNFEIPDEWWREAGMDDFRPSGEAYDSTPPGEWPCRTVPLHDIELPTRNKGVELFKRDRIVKILSAFASGDSLPPIEVHEPPDASPRYAVRDGFHRFYASIAAGYTAVPVEVRPYFNPRS